MKLNDKVYNVLKWITLIGLPAVSSLYFGLAGIWGFPYAEQVVGTIAVLTTFLGIILGISTAQYNKTYQEDGTLKIDTSNPDKDIYRIDLGENLEKIAEKSCITLKVDPAANLTDGED